MGRLHDEPRPRARAATVSIHLAPLTEVQRVLRRRRSPVTARQRRRSIARRASDGGRRRPKGVAHPRVRPPRRVDRSNPPFQAGTTARSAGPRTRTCASQGSPRATSTRAPRMRPVLAQSRRSVRETYRVLNEQKLGLPQESWNIVTRRSSPMPRRSACSSRTSSRRGRRRRAKKLTAKLTSKIRTRTFTLATPYDGTISVASRQAGQASRCRCSPKGATVGKSAFKRASGRRSRRPSAACAAIAFARAHGQVTKPTKTTVTLTVAPY